MNECKYHKGEDWFIRQGEPLVVYADIFRRDNGASILIEWGITSERKARVKEPIITTQDEGLDGYTHTNSRIFKYAKYDNGPAGTLNELLKPFEIDYQINELPREHWFTLIKHFIEQLPNIPVVQEAYLVGGLTTDKEAAKDADLLLVSNGCGSTCSLTTIETKLDLFCFTEEEFEQLKSDKDIVIENMQLLYRKNNPAASNQSKILK